METVRALVLHLRLPFQLMLAPFLLVGALSAGGAPDFGWVGPFLAVHVGLYGGATAYNSFYDRDRGPIGFMKKPRPVSRPVRDLALGLMAASVAALAAVDPMAGVIAGVMAMMGIAYSHPRVRWKKSMTGGLAAVAIGQGAGAIYLGSYAMGGGPSTLTNWAAIGGAFVAAGLYPITQVYQTDEDRDRGDLTLPVRYGWRAAFVFSFLAASTGLLVLAAAFRALLPPGALWVLRGAPIALAVALCLWARRFENQSPDQNHDWAMGLGVAASATVWALLVIGFASG